MATPTWRVPRLLVLRDEGRNWRAAADSYRLAAHARGSIANLHVAPGVPPAAAALGSAAQEGPALAAHEVEVRVHAAGLNFRDVLDVLGLYPTGGAHDGGAHDGEGAPFAPGDDCAGVVTRVGSDAARRLSVGQFVFGSPGFARGVSAFSTTVRSDARLLVGRPAALTHEQACTLPTVFATAYEAARRLRVQRGSRVIVHAGAGGVGLVVLEMLRSMGADAIITAGRPSKHRILHGVDAGRRTSSRDAHAFVFGGATVLRASRADGVINSLSADFIPSSAALLKEGAAFVEIGKRGVWSEARVTSAAAHVAPHVLDIAAMAPSEPSWYQRVMATLAVAGRAAADVVTPLPMHRFDLRAHAQQAYRFLQAGRNVGKVVLCLAPAGPVRGGREAPSRGRGTHIITGGLGGLGLLTARYLNREGADRIVLASRSGTVRGAQTAALDELLAASAGAGDRRNDQREVSAGAAAAPPTAAATGGVWRLDAGLI